MSDCVICGRELPDNRPMVHVHCEATVGQHLDELTKLWPLLLDRGDSRMEPPGLWRTYQLDSETGEVAAVLGREPVAELLPAGPTKSRTGVPARGTREPPVPADLDHLDLTADISPQSLRVPRDPEQVGYLAVATELDFWVKDWAGHLEQDLPGTDVPTLADWLRQRLGWACIFHHAIDEFAAAVERIVGVVRHRAGETDDRMKVGRCPAVRDDRTCGATLRADAWLDVIECPRCTTRWHRSQWLILAGIAREERS